MLHVSIHAGPLSGVSRTNRLDWLDIGYEALDAVADYKVVLFSLGRGATPPVLLKSYPRWSASLWDLSARAIALAGSQDPDKPQERLPPLEEVEKRFAQATAVSAVIVHKDATGYSTRQLASMAIVRYPRANGVYRATLIEDMLPALSTVPFVFRPKYLRPAELVARAALVALTGGLRELPPRPALRLPTTQVIEGVPHIVLQRMAEPARTGFRRWLHRENLPIVGELDGIPGGVTPETLYARFLREAV